MPDEIQHQEVVTPELAALNAVVRALRSLNPDLRRRVIDSALIYLGSGASLAAVGSPTSSVSSEAIAPLAAADTPKDIRQLKDQKSPGSANEMTALVAYYLSELVPFAERQSTVDMNDVLKYFKQAQFRLPSSPKMILVNAKNAGYFDAVGGGQYKLNPVGYNLVVHSLPRAAAGSDSRRKRSRAN